MSTVLETIDGGTRYLDKRGVEDARRNMQMLVAHQLGCTRMDLYTQFDRPLEEANLGPLRELLKRRGEGVPLQHLIGSVEFYGRSFACDARGLIPRPESEELVELLLLKETVSGPRVLDVGCGSGVLGLSLAAERPDWQVTLTDISSDALSLAKQNAESLELQNVNFVLGDLLSAVSGPFDGIVANLPYVPETERAELSREVMHDPALALFGGEDGLAVIRRFLPQAIRALRPGAWLAMEVGHQQAAQLAELLTAAGFVNLAIHCDLSGIDRFPFARRPPLSTS